MTINIIYMKTCRIVESPTVGMMTLMRHFTLTWRKNVYISISRFSIATKLLAAYGLILSINNCVPYCFNDKKEYAYDK